MSKSSALERRIQSYPPPGLYNQLVRYAASHGMSNSEAAVHMMRCFLNPPGSSATTKANGTALKQNING